MEFIKNNKFLVHVVAEVSCLCLVVLYIAKNNKGIYNHMQYLEQKLYQYENILEKHDQLLSTLLNKKVSFKEPLNTQIPVVKKQTPVMEMIQEEDIVEVEDDSIIETRSVEEDNLDEEIEEELSKLNLN